MTRISAIICTRDHPNLIGRAVSSVLVNDHDSFELLVMDQSADDRTRQVLSAFEGNEHLRYIHLETAGLSIARNAGIENAAAPLIAFTDDDCVAPRDWLHEVESAYMRYPNAELMYGQTLAPPELWGLGVVPAFHIAKEELYTPRTRFRTPGMGATLALRRRLVDRIGGFDEALGAGGVLRASEDFDFQFRAMRNGASCLYTPKVWVRHYGLRTWNEWSATQKAYGIGDAAFYLKHVRCGDALALRLLVTRLVRLTAREILNPIRRKPSQSTYLRSYLNGARESLRYGIDREARLYVLNKSTTV